MTSTINKSNVEFWNRMEEVLQEILPPLTTGNLPLLEQYHPDFPSFDSPPILLRRNAKFAYVLALEDRWDDLILAYGQLNTLQREERVLTDKLAYLLGHYQEAVARSDLVSKSVLFVLARRIVMALGTLNADDYATRESLNSL